MRYRMQDTHFYTHINHVCITLYAHQPPHTCTSYHTDHLHYVNINYTHVSYMYVCTSFTYISHMRVHIIHTCPSNICIKQTASICMRHHTPHL